MRYLILSDIHDNLEAATVAIGEAKKMQIDTVVYLGDILGYGASPRECLDLARAERGYYILGNHEYAMLVTESEEHMNPLASWAIDWTRERIDAADLDFIKTFKLIEIINGITFVHGSPRAPAEFDYILDAYEADRAFRYFETTLCFVGHTHVPVLFIEGDRRSHKLKPGTVKLDPKKRYIINGGSVGQPRDRDKRTSFVVFDSDKYEITLYRYNYDNQTAAQKIRDAGLPESLAKRLL